ncbi:MULTISPECIES: hypothetical protein [Pseudanabaena]|uniref:hypothetical protein n=1 Tax=Pseudanabaena TaxID=1152 RepID=UPI00247947E3|nr:MULTISPECIES: hypothetical protein [Pseudanabaena]MEA5485928.1 hypothetical protein [Pseudanabaena sp. CCNP1317]WGS71346.1 hypothetical protein OA858_16745 [Pseudanabaena galeata CCNP1313]
MLRFIPHLLKFLMLAIAGLAIALVLPVIFGGYAIVMEIMPTFLMWLWRTIFVVICLVLILTIFEGFR